MTTNSPPNQEVRFRSPLDEWRRLFVLNRLQPNLFTQKLYLKIIHAATALYPYSIVINPYPTAFPYGNGMVLHFYQQQESSTTKTVHKVINKGLKTYV